MSRSTNMKSRPTDTINKADQQRQEKQRKLEENNLRISKQLEKSVNSWQNSMEQIRKIAQKAQDSSQIKDNVFTENENDQSEMELEQQRLESRSNTGDQQLSRQGIQSQMSVEPSYRPMSRYANSSDPFTQFLRNRTQISNNTDLSSPQNHQHVPMDYQNQRPSVEPGPDTYFDRTYITPRFTSYNTFQSPSWQSQNFNQSNQTACNWNTARPTAIGQSSRMRFPQFYQPTVPYGYHRSQYSSFPPGRECDNSMEMMKQYLTTLLDKIELLNDTVTKLKQENESTRRASAGCCPNHERQRIMSQGVHQIQRNHGQCTSHAQLLNRRQLSCSCMDIRRPPSSVSQFSHACNTSSNQMRDSSFKQSFRDPHANCSHGTIRETNVNCSNYRTSPRSLQGYPSNRMFRPGSTN